MIELQGLQQLGWAVFIVVIAYSAWVSVLISKNLKHRRTILELLDKLQRFENEVDQYRSTMREQILLIIRLNQEISNLKQEPLTLEKAYKEAINKIEDLEQELRIQRNAVIVLKGSLNKGE